jgi:hypothetical protein
MIVIPLSADEESNITTGSVVDHMIESNVSIDQSVTTSGRHDVDRETDPDENDGEKILTLDESINDQHEEPDESNSKNIPTDLNLAPIISDDESSSDLTDDNAELKQEIEAHETNERVNDAHSKNEIQEGIENSDQDDVERKKNLEMANDKLVNMNDSETESDVGELSENNVQEINENSSESEISEKGLDEEPTPKTVFVDYANKSTGALILDKAKNFQGTSNLLLDDKDRYAMIPCNDEQTKYVIIGLSEDILVKSIRLSSFERYSSLTKQFQVLGSQTYPIMTEWEDLGTFEAKPWFKENKEQSFELETPSWARYLKFRFLSHYGDEHYLTVTQIKVHGSTTLQGYHEMQLEMEANQAEDLEELVSEVDTSQENEQPTILSEKDQFEVSADIIANEEHHEDHHDDRKNDVTVDLTVEKEVNDEKISNEEIIQSESESTSVMETTETINTSVNADHEDSSKSYEQASSTIEKVSDESQDETYENTVESSSYESDTNDSAQHKNPTAESNVDDSAEKIDISNHEKLIIEEDSVPQNSSDQSDDHAIPDDVEKVKSQKLNTPNVKEAVKSAIETVQKVATIKDAVKEINKSLNSRVKDNDDEQSLTESAISDHDRLTDPPKDPVPNTNSGSQEDAVVQDDTDTVISEISYAENLEDGRANGTDVSAGNSNATQTTSTDESNVETKANLKPSLNSKTLESIDAPPDAKDLLKHLTSDYSNADCLKKLDFQEFKKKAMKAIQAQKGSTTGATSSIPKNEPIFKKLADEIKVLQTSQGIFEQYIKAVSTCYESLMSKMGEHIKSLEDNQDRRLSSIEEKIQALSKGQVPFPTTDDDKNIENDFYDQEDESFKGRIHSFFVDFIKWMIVVYHLILDSIRLFLADERVQKGIEILLGYKRDISLVLFGYIFSFLLTKYKTRDENEVISQKNITPNSFTDSKEVRDNHKDSKVPVQMPTLHEDTSIIYSFRSDDVSIDGENEDTNHLNMNTKTTL